MADAEKQKEMDAKKAEVEDVLHHHRPPPYCHHHPQCHHGHDHQCHQDRDHQFHHGDDDDGQVRARLEAQAAGKKNKKGFMTPERKKKLRV